MEAVTSGTIYAVGVPIILLMITCEAVVSSWKHYNFYERGDTLGTLGLLAGNIVMAGLTKGFAFIFYLYLYNDFSPVKINDLAPTWAVWVLTFDQVTETVESKETGTAQPSHPPKVESPEASKAA